MLTRTPSEEIKLPQDSAFPIFPVKRKAPPTHLGLHDVKMSTARNQAPLSPNYHGPNILKRMNTITSGPFNIRSKRPSSRDQAQAGAPEPVAAPESSGREHLEQPPLPPARPPRPDTDDSLLEKLQSATIGSPHEPTVDSKPDLTISPPAPSEPSQDEVPSIAESLENTNAERAALPVPSERPTPEPSIPPLPDLTSLHSTAQRHHNHTSVSSESSNSSRSGFGSRTESSRSSHSSPFTLISPTTSHRKTISVDQQSNPPPASESLPTRHKSSDSETKEAAFGEPSPLSINTSAGSPTSLRADRHTAAVNSIMSPSPGRTEFPRTDPRDASLRAEPTARTPTDQRPRPGPRSKGDCRGCSTPIFGKSIKAADGRLSGRYHRECFVCHTCKEAFDTAEFYVLNDLPYCAHHYHVLNHSLCVSCNHGIEGEYLETAPRKRYHLGCFICSGCQKSLTSDYYEINQRFYCESDAFRIHEKTRLLAPGKRFPERRTTRLMVM